MYIEYTTGFSLVALSESGLDLKIHAIGGTSITSILLTPFYHTVLLMGPPSFSPNFTRLIHPRKSESSTSHVTLVNPSSIQQFLSFSTACYVPEFCANPKDEQNTLPASGA